MLPITNYFQVQKKSVNVYKNCIQDTLCDCSDDTVRIKQQMNEMNEKTKQIENAINTVKLVICEKENEIKNLQEKLSQSVPICDANKVQHSQELLFDSFSRFFTLEQLTVLRSIGPQIRSDASFIRYAVQSIYSDKLETIKMKSVCGRKSKNGSFKEPITPEKKSILDSIFAERLRAICTSVLDHNNRKKQFNKLVKYAFMNISKSVESKKEETDVRRQLNFE